MTIELSTMVTCDHDCSTSGKQAFKEFFLPPGIGENQAEPMHAPGSWPVVE